MQNKTETKKAKWQLPWWFHLLLAILCYFLLKYIVPLYMNGPENKAIIQVTGKAAPIVTIIFLLLAANGLYTNDSEKDPDQKQPDDPTDQ